MELPSGLAAVLIYLQPVLTGVLAVPLLGESLALVKVVGLLVGFSGIVVVSAGALEGHVSASGSGYAVTGALVWSLGTIAFKRYADRVDVVVGGGAAVPGRRASCCRWPVAIFEGTTIEWSSEFVAAFVYASMIGTAMSWSLWFGLVGSGEAGRVASYIFFVPIVALVTGGLLLGESLGASVLIGAALVIVGVYLVNRGQRGRRYHRHCLEVLDREVPVRAPHRLRRRVAAGADGMHRPRAAVSDEEADRRLDEGCPPSARAGC